MDLIRQLRSELRRSLHGPAWHGPALLEVLADVTPAEACAHPVPGAHSIAELALHALAWIEEVTRRLQGAVAALPERGDWPLPPPDLQDPGWRSIHEELSRGAERLERTVGGFPPERLLEQVAGSDAQLGGGIRHVVMLHGLAQHNAYHGGQIALLKRALRERSPTA
ncbi:MAG TPA: DinB family protein [Longimicrobiaceae bacterium]|nr:DinB family protein [Longimicrobiaceae bacterium]